MSERMTKSLIWEARFKMTHKVGRQNMHKTRRGRTGRLRKIRGHPNDMAELIRGKVVHDEKYDLFLDWLRKHHFPKSKLVLAEFPNTGRGMMATSDIEPGEVIVSVPKMFLISNDELTKLYGLHPLSVHQLLTFHLVRLKHDPTTWWRPYLDLLPSHFDTMPVNYPSDLLRRLPTSLVEEVTQQRKKIQSDYAAAVRFAKARGMQVTSPEEFEWAWLCVNTRCIHMSNMDATIKGSNVAMAPVLDFLNHSWEAQIESGFNVRTQCFEIRTLTPYRKGEQVFINYGPHDNMSILREYGFVIPNNVYNYVSLDREVWELFDAMETPRGIKAKKAILEKAGYSGDYSIKKNEISFRLLAALRLLAIKGPDVQSGFDNRVLAWHDVVMGEIEIISTENERRVLLMLKSICERVYNKAVKEDATLMAVSSQAKERKFHPFSLAFAKQIWKETADIAKITEQEIQERLRQLTVDVQSRSLCIDG